MLEASVVFLVFVMGIVIASAGLIYVLKQGGDGASLARRVAAFLDVGVEGEAAAARRGVSALSKGETQLQELRRTIEAIRWRR